jgi:glucose-6-phosphate 1-epimerase
MTDSLPTITLAAPEGAVAVIYPHGAHIASWKPAGGGERLFLSPASAFEPGSPIRGGVPVIFPQFSGMGPLPKHGFARLQTWQAAQPQLGADFASITLSLRANEQTLALWPHPFLAEMTIRLGGPRLAMTLAITNTGSAPFTFTAALHTYFAVADVLTTAVAGLAGTRYHDTTVNPWAEGVQAEAEVRFAGEVDSIFYAAPRHLAVRTPEYGTRIEAEGFPDAVVWNPGRDKCSRLPDLPADGYRRFVCVEAAAIGQAVSLLPDAQWRGTQTLIAE